MIVSKPQTTAITALGIFIILCLAMGGYALRAILNGVGAWYHYLIAILTLSVGIILLIRQLLTYKVISIGESVVKIYYPLRWKVKSFKLKDLLHWKETVIKTKNAPFKQLELKFDGFLLKLSIQENTNYTQVSKYLKKRVAKKMIL